jgi:hypothetical protein
LPRRGEELKAHAPRPVVSEGPKKPKQWKRDRQLDTFAREVAAGKPNLKTFRSLGLSAAEKHQLRELTRRYSREVQAENDPQEKVAGALVGPELAKALPGGSPAREMNPAWGAVEAAGILPIGRPFSAAARAARAARGAKAVKPVVEGADKIVGALPAAKRARTQKDAAIRTARGKRFAKSEAAGDEVAGQAGYRAQLGELGGKLAPEIPVGRLLNEFGAADSELRRVFQPQVDGLFNAIRGSKNLSYTTRLNTERALNNALEGKTPTKSDIRLLGEMFGEDARKALAHKRVTENLVRVLNLPRSLRTTFDLSLAFRQLLVSGVRHPIVWSKTWKAQVQAAASPKKAQAMMDEIAARPRYDEMVESGLAVRGTSGGIATREEPHISDLAERIPGVGIPVRASSRAFTVGGAFFRANLYDLLVDHAERGGLVFNRGGKVLSKAEKRDLASVINAGTGRGNMGSQTLERAAPFLTMGLFSPRLIASRIAFLNPAYYAKLSPPARLEAAQSMVALVGAGMAVLWLAKQAGAVVADDPRNADFGKIRVGDSRIDIWGGFQQYIVNGYRIAVEESVSSTTGEVKKLEGGFAQPSRFDIAEDFAVGKLAPVPGWVAGSWKGKNFEGEDFSEVREGLKQFVPLGWESAYDTYKASGDPAATAAMFGLGFVGIGGQTYSSKPAKGKRGPASWGQRSRGSGGGPSSWGR